MERTLEATRRLARMSLAEYPVIPHERVLFAVMNADNLDRDIANLCAPLDADLARMN